MQITDPEFIAFLIRAKQATYAGGGAEVLPSRPNSHDLRYSEGDLLYIDTYLGGYEFIGEEAVWHQSQPLWGMNYYGWMLVPEIPDGFSPFLKDTLKQLPEQSPFRGPAHWERGDFAYRCQWSGSMPLFSGEEEIRYHDDVIYRLVFHGGRIR